MELRGFEPRTPCLQSRCSSQLSYSPFQNIKTACGLGRGEAPLRQRHAGPSHGTLHPAQKQFHSTLSANSSQLSPVGLGGVEPPTSRLSGVRSNHLSYKPIFMGHRSGDPRLAPSRSQAHRPGPERPQTQIISRSLASPIFRKVDSP